MTFRDRQKRPDRKIIDIYHRNNITDHKNKECRNRRIKRRCMLLSSIGMVLLGGLIVRYVKYNQTEPVGYYTYFERIQWETERTAEGTMEDALILVNKDHRIPEGYVPKLHWLNNRSCAVSEQIYDSLSQMLTAGSTEGRQYVVASGYRSREEQKQLLEADIAEAILKDGLSYEEAYEQEIRETMPPGYSEHETGLAVDIVALGYQMLDEGQELTEENQWLQENCSRYGFILRYPRGKEEITGVDYESWHFRYVGEDAAKEIMDRGITLEEFLGEK